MNRLLLAMALGCPLLGAGPSTWELSQYADFIKGKLKNVSLSREGVLQPGPAIGVTGGLDEVSLWSMAAAADGTVYLGTGPKGRIYERKAGSKALRVLATLPEPHVFALAVGAGGEVYAAGSPGGNVYRVESGQAKLFAQTGAKFVWSLVATRDGVFAGGDDGRIFRTTATVSEVYYDSGQSNMTALAMGADGALIAGSDPNGIVYRIASKGKAQVLYDAPFTEIRSLLPRRNGELLFLAMGGAAMKRTQTVAQPAGGTSGGVPQVTTTITVTEEAQAGLDLKAKPAAPQAAAAAAPATAVQSSLDVPGLDRSAIYRLNADQTVDTLYVTKEETLYDLVERDSKIFFSTDKQGRVYQLEADRSATLVVESGESEIGRMLAGTSGLVAAVTTSPKLLEIGGTPSGPYEYESPIHEASNIALWGAFQVSMSGEPRLESRSGNSSKPDATWSEWQPLKGWNAQSPAGRYVQWRLKAEKDFRLRAVTLHYLPRNQPPVVKSLTAVLAMVPSNAPKPQTAAGISSTYTLTVTDTGEATGSSSAGTASQLATRPAGRQLMLSWVAEDPDSDILQYSLYFRAEDETDWKLLKKELSESSYTIDADTLADGRYLFRLTASDVLSNSAATSQSVQFSSVPVQLDQTAPLLEARMEGNRLVMRCVDLASPVRRMEYSINAGQWVGVDAADGIYDSLEERGTAELALGSGESIVTVRAFDASLNVTLRKLVVRR